MDERKYLSALLDRQRELAVSAIERPTGQDPYHYGYAAGVFRGISLAVEVLKQQLGDEKESDL
jgi:hypothetical protein